MRTWQIAAVILLVVSAAQAQQTGDMLEAREDTEITDDGRSVGVIPMGYIVTVEKVDQDKVWCKTGAGTGWIARKDLMTLERAVDLWREAIRQGDFNSWFRLGHTHDGMGETELALDDFTHYLRTHPGATEGLNARGFMYVKLGQPEKAAEDFSLEIQIEPSATGYVNRADVYVLIGKAEAAIEDCDAALKLEPDSTYALVNRGNARRLLGEFDKAVADYEAALKTDEASAGALRNYALLRGAAADEKFRDGKQAIELAQKACDATSTRDALSLSSLAVASAETGDFDAAIKWQKLAIEREKLKKNQPEYKRRLELFEAHRPLRLKIGEAVPDD